MNAVEFLILLIFGGLCLLPFLYDYIVDWDEEDYKYKQKKKQEKKKEKEQEKNQKGGD